MLDPHKISADAVDLFPMQSGEHIQTMQYLLEHLDTRTNGFIEIGSAYGGSFFCWASIMNGFAISIDLPAAIGVSPEKQEFRNKSWVDKFGERVHIIEENSMSIEKIHPRLDEILGDNKVDFLFIDANHSYPATHSDFHNYKKYVRSGGFVGFHDIYHPAHLTGCRQVFDEAEGKKHMTDPSFGWAGIGILQV